MKATKPQIQEKLDVEALARDDKLADKYNVTVTNSFSILGSLPEDVEISWAAVRTTILDAARDTSNCHQTKASMAFYRDLSHNPQEA